MREARAGRIAVAVLGTGLLVAAIGGGALATSDDENGEHTVRICHVTESDGNPYVEMTVDVAAFDGEGSSDHTHHVAKDGRMDVQLAEGESCPTVGGGGSG